MKNKQLFSKLFHGDDRIVAGDRFSKYPELMGNVLNNYDNPEFYTINAIHPDLDFRTPIASKPGSRASINVTKLKTFMFEFDDMPLKNQLRFLKNCNIPWTGIVFSGGKSYHALLSLAEPIEGAHTIEGVARYKIIHQRISAYLNRKVRELEAGLWEVDNATQDPARFSRFPGSLRNGKEQEVLHVGDEISSNDFGDLLERCPLITTRKTVIAPPECSADTEQKFWALCPTSLRRKLRYVNWARPSGNYSEIYKLTLWAIDATDVTKDVFLSILHTHTFPWLDKQGYRSDPEKGVNDAFLYKRRF